MSGVTDALGRPIDPGWISGSALATALKCSASPVLWRVLGSAVAATRIGSALHDHVRQRNLYGISAAVEMLPELAQRHELNEQEADLFYARARAFEWNPPTGSISELALCLFEDGSVRAVAGGKGAYDSLGPDAIIPAQIDIFWAEPEPLYRDDEGRIVCPPNSVLWVVDFKSGKETYVEDAERNAQVLASTILAAKFTGATKAVPCVVFLRKGQGVWDFPENYLDLAAIDHVTDALVAAVHEVRRQRDAHRRGLPLVYREGTHCNMCRARFGCPAHLSTIKAWTGDPAPIEPGALTEEQLVRLAELAPAFRAFAKSVDDALRSHVIHTGKPIRLPDGRVYGPHSTPRTTFDLATARAALAAEVGPDAALAACPSRMPESAIKRAIKDDHNAKGLRKQGGSAFRRVYARMASAGGIIKSTRVQWGFHRPAAQLPEGVDPSAAIAELHELAPEDGDFPDDE